MEKIINIFYALAMIFIIITISYLFCIVNFNDEYPTIYKQIESGARI